MWSFVFFFQAEDGIRDLVRSRGLGDVYKRQIPASAPLSAAASTMITGTPLPAIPEISFARKNVQVGACLLYTSDAADERSSVDLGGRRIIKKKKIEKSSDDLVTRKNLENTDTSTSTHYTYTLSTE